MADYPPDKQRRLELHQSRSIDLQLHLHDHIQVVGSEFGAEAENATISKKRKPTSHESATRAPGYSSSRSLPPAYNSTHDNRPESAWPASSQQYFSDPLYRGPNDVSVGLSESSSSRQQNPSLFVNTLHDEPKWNNYAVQDSSTPYIDTSRSDPLLYHGGTEQFIDMGSGSSAYLPNGGRAEFEVQRSVFKYRVNEAVNDFVSSLLRVAVSNDSNKTVEANTDALIAHNNQEFASNKCPSIANKRVVEHAGSGLSSIPRHCGSSKRLENIKRLVEENNCSLNSHEIAINLNSGVSSTLLTDNDVSSEYIISSKSLNQPFSGHSFQLPGSLTCTNYVKDVESKDIDCSTLSVTKNTLLKCERNSDKNSYPSYPLTSQVNVNNTIGSPKEIMTTESTEPQIILHDDIRGITEVAPAHTMDAFVTTDFDADNIHCHYLLQLHALAASITRHLVHTGVLADNTRKKTNCWN